MNTQEIQGRWEQIRGKVKEKWGQLSDDDLKIVGGNVEQLIGRIQQKTGEARRNVEQFLDELASPDAMTRARESAAAYSQAAWDSARQGFQQVGTQTREGWHRAESLVQHHPTESLLTMFGIGFVTGLVIGVLTHSD